MRERLDELDPLLVRSVFKKIFAKLQRGKCLESFKFLDGYYLVSLDGTGEFLSGSICCPQCCKKEHKNGLLEENKMKYLLGAKPRDHLALFAELEASTKTQYYEVCAEKGFFHQFQFLNDVALNKSNSDVRVNVLEYMQTNPKGKETVFSWVTNIHITKNNIFTLMKGSRSRWKIENETFDTLKNLGYNFEHNYGHGNKYLSIIFYFLMLLAFLVDQVQGMICSLFQAVKKQAASFQFLWEKLRVLFEYVEWSS